MRNPWIIAIANYLVWGLGSILLGKRTVASSLIVLGCVPLTYASVVLSPLGPQAAAAPRLWPVIMAGMLTVSIGFAIAGFHEAREA